jgi:aquaporin Z
MFLAFKVLGATDIKSPVGFAGVAIGFVLTLIHEVGIPITNTPVNPARSIGPAASWEPGRCCNFCSSSLHRS